MAPLRPSARESLEQLLTRAAGALAKEPRTRLVVSRDGYRHLVVVSALIRFVDDVELVADQSQQVVHMRSSSRLGYWDGGVNHNRLERLRAALGQ